MNLNYKNFFLFLSFSISLDWLFFVGTVPIILKQRISWKKISNNWRVVGNKWMLVLGIKKKETNHIWEKETKTLTFFREKKSVSFGKNKNPFTLFFLEKKKKKKGCFLLKKRKNKTFTFFLFGEKKNKNKKRGKKTF